MRLIGYFIAICAGLAIALAAQTWYVKTQVIAKSAFAHRATQVAAEPSVRSTIAGEVADVVESRAGVSAQTVVPVVDQALGSRSFNRLLSTGARRFNAALFHNSLRTQSLDISLDGLLKSTAIPAGALDDVSVNLVTARARSALRDTNDAADVIRFLSIALLVFAAGALLVAMLFARRLFRLVAMAALGVAVAGALTLPVLSHLRSKTIHALRFSQGLDPKHSASFAAAIWDGFFGEMHTVALVSLVGGLAVWVVGSMLGSRTRAIPLV